jgi:hypothetical protein
MQLLHDTVDILDDDILVYDGNILFAIRKKRLLLTLDLRSAGAFPDIRFLFRQNDDLHI